MVVAEVELEVAGIGEEALALVLQSEPAVRDQEATRALDRVFGKRVIVVGGGAQIAQVALGAVSESDRHNLRGERISVDTIALVGEHDDRSPPCARSPTCRAPTSSCSRARSWVVRSPGRPRAPRGGYPGRDAEHGRVGDPGGRLVVSDPVQAGTMAVMAIADTARFDLSKQRGRRY